MFVHIDVGVGCGCGGTPASYLGRDRAPLSPTVHYHGHGARGNTSGSVRSYRDVYRLLQLHERRRQLAVHLPAKQWQTKFTLNIALLLPVRQRRAKFTLILALSTHLDEHVTRLQHAVGSASRQNLGPTRDHTH